MKNIVLKSLTVINLFVFILCACCIDSQNATPFYIGCIISLAYLTLFAYANGYMGGRYAK